MTKLATIRDTQFPACPIRNILSRFGDKWSILTLLTLHEKGTLRFSALQKAIPDVSQKMLTTTLRTLEQDGLVKRKIYATVPPKVEYRLTETGASLMPLIEQLITWALKHMKTIVRHRRKYGTEGQ